MIARIDYSWGDALAALPFERRPEVQKWADIVLKFEAATDKTAVALEIRHAYGVPQATLYRRMKAYKEEGVTAFLPAAARRKLASEGLNLPSAFVSFWQTLCEENQRKIAPAYRALFFDHLCAGKVIPGYGPTGQGADWRGIYAQQNRDWSVPTACPYRPYDATPDGWSESNLRRYAPDKWCQTAARIGRSAASLYLPKIPTTRVGLRFGQVFAIDDVYHDNKVSFVGNREPQICVELGALELLTGHYCSWGIKPVREKDDGGREVLREAYMRYLLADIVCRIGICPDGCLIAGEHGTARIPADLLQTLNRWFGGRELIRFGAGGLRHEPIARGLFEGRPGGNFRFKAALESHHALKKNELAQLPGQKGMDPAHAPEDLATKTSYHVALVKACVALAEERPDLFSQIRSPFPHYLEYVEAVSLLYSRIANRHEHEIEGYEECGFTVEEFRQHPSAGWMPLPMLLSDASPEEREAVYALIQANPRQRYQRRLMSPREAFDYCASKHQVLRLPEAAIPEILGPSLGDVLRIDDDAAFHVPDRQVPSKRHIVPALVETDRGSVLLDRGTAWMVHMSPIDARYAYVSRPGGQYIGRCQVLVPGTKVDIESMRRNLGIVKQVESTELRRLAPIAEKRMREQTEMSEHNATMLGAGAVPAGKTTEEKRLESLAEDALARNYKEGDTDNDD